MIASTDIEQTLLPIKEKIWQILETVTDPEVPVLTIIDLGIIRDLQVNCDPLTDALKVQVTITPTYTGCPAMDMISMNIRLALAEHGFKEVDIKSVLSPSWTTDWMTEAGKQKLKQYGIAPPQYPVGLDIDAVVLFQEKNNISCPLCSSTNTRLISQFGSTACKALYQCNDCKEPFDYFKCH